MKLNRANIYKILFWTALVSSYILAILPQSEVPKITPLSDKGNHFIAFATLTLLLFYAYRVSYVKNTLLMFFYGLWIEFSQLFTVNRQGEWADVVADTIGILIGLIIYWIINWWVKKSASKQKLL